MGDSPNKKYDTYLRVELIQTTLLHFVKHMSHV